MKRALSALLAAPLLLTACSNETSPENWESADDISAAIQEVNGNCANPDEEPGDPHGDCGTPDTGFYYYALFGEESELDEELVTDPSMLGDNASSRIQGEDWVIWCWLGTVDNCLPLHEEFGGTLTTFPNE